MTLPELKEALIKNQPINSVIIFKCEDEDFVPLSYIKQWAIIRSAQVKYINDLDEIVNDSPFFDSQSLQEILYIYELDYLEGLDPYYKEKDNLFIICDRIKKEVLNDFKDLIVEVPKLENWQIKDYCSINYLGVTDEQLEWLISNCKGSIYRALNELDKLKSFPVDTRKSIFDDLRNNGQFEEAAGYTIFNLVDAIQSKDILKINEILDSGLELNPIGLNTNLLNKFKSLIKVWLNPNPTELNTGLSSKQIWFLNNKVPKNYSRDQLIKIFNLLTSIDYKLKNGELSENLLNDYMLTQVLTI